METVDAKVQSPSLSIVNFSIAFIAPRNSFPVHPVAMSALNATAVDEAFDQAARYAECARALLHRSILCATDAADCVLESVILLRPAAEELTLLAPNR